MKGGSELRPLGVNAKSRNPFSVGDDAGGSMGSSALLALVDVRSSKHVSMIIESKGVFEDSGNRFERLVGTHGQRLPVLRIPSAPSVVPGLMIPAPVV
jgi:hypothetical protein